MVIRGLDKFLFSREGVTQGDPLSMFMYAQVWYADGASGCGSPADIRKWFYCLHQSGPDFGYFVNAGKCCLAVDRLFLNEACSHFSDVGIQIVCGQRYLGGFLGDSVSHTNFVEQKVERWVSDVGCLAEISVTQPQAAFAALTKSLQCELHYL